MEVGWPNPPSRNWVRPGLNRLERVHAVFVCAGFAKAEKVRVLRCRVWIGDMDIPPFRIGLPDLHHGALDGPALLVGSSARDMNVNRHGIPPGHGIGRFTIEPEPHTSPRSSAYERYSNGTDGGCSRIVWITQKSVTRRTQSRRTPCGRRRRSGPPGVAFPPYSLQARRVLDARL